jgi:hypothetical protein
MSWVRLKLRIKRIKLKQFCLKNNESHTDLNDSKISSNYLDYNLNSIAADSNISEMNPIELNNSVLQQIALLPIQL